MRCPVLLEGGEAGDILINMRKRVEPSMLAAAVEANHRRRISLKSYAPAMAESDGSVVVLKDTGLSNPNAANVSRQRFGRSISLDRIESALRLAHAGSMMQLTDLSRETVETDPHLGAVLNKRFGAVSCLPYEVRPATGNGVDKAKALFYASVVWEQLKNLTHFRRMLRQLAWALFDGRSAVELFWQRVNGPSLNGYGAVRLAVTATGWIHPRRLSFGPKRELVVTDESNFYGIGNFSSPGIVLDSIVPGKFVTWQPQLFGEYQEREGLAPRCMYWSFFKRYSQRERMILLELFGKPWRVVTADEESQASAEDLLAAEEAADGLGGAFTARMPRGIKLDVVQPGRTAGQVHQEVIEECDKQISKLVLGQTGTTDGVPAGLNSSQASVMQDEQLMILTSDATEMSEITENQLTDQIIAANFGVSELPYAPMFVLRSDLPADRLKEVERLTAALNAGLEVSLSEAYEISGFRMPERTEPVLRVDQPPTPPLSPTPPAARPVIVWPPGSSPPAGEQQPPTPQASESEGARDGAGVTVGSADQKHIIKVNEAREGQGLPPLTLPDGSPDPNGDLTVAEYEAKLNGEKAKSIPGGQEPQADDGSPIDLKSVPLTAEFGRESAQLTVRHEGSRWCVYSSDGSRSFGCYPSRKQAEERLKQVEGFKHMDSLADVARLELAVENEAVLRIFGSDAASLGFDRCMFAKQPSTVNGSPEDIIDEGRSGVQRAVNHWGAEIESALEKARSVEDVLKIASRVFDGLDDLRFEAAMTPMLVRSAMLGALDGWFDEGSTTVAPVTFADTNSKFSTTKFPDAVRWFVDKNVVDKPTFERLTDAAKRKAFTVAALTKQQMLYVVHDELARHVAAGADIRTFAPAFKERLKSAGFVAAGEKAEAAYIDNVFRTNVLGAYNAGRYERQTQPEVLRARPYWQIRTVSDDRRRTAHGRADGLVLRATDPFWQRAYPPFGFQCRCRTVSLSEKQAQNIVITDGSTIDYLPDRGFVSGVRSLLAAVWSRKSVELLLLDD